jgi:predicted Mrr-cat superfamily restriction endonuclease
MPGQINGEYKSDAITSEVYTNTRKFEWKRRDISTSIFEDNIQRCK